MTTDLRTASVTCREGRGGAHVITAAGIAGTVTVVTRSAAVGCELAVYASLFGELPRSDWEAPMSAEDIARTASPFAMSWDSEAHAEDIFAKREAVWTAAIRGELVEAQPFAEDRDLTSGQWAKLDAGDAVYFNGHLVILGVDGCAHMLAPGRTYTDAHGQRFAA